MFSRVVITDSYAESQVISKYLEEGAFVFLDSSDVVEDNFDIVDSRPVIHGAQALHFYDLDLASVYNFTVFDLSRQLLKKFDFQENSEFFNVLLEVTRLALIKQYSTYCVLEVFRRAEIEITCAGTPSYQKRVEHVLTSLQVPCKLCVSSSESFKEVSVIGQPRKQVSVKCDDMHRDWNNFLINSKKKILELKKKSSIRKPIAISILPRFNTVLQVAGELYKHLRQRNLFPDLIAPVDAKRIINRDVLGYTINPESMILLSNLSLKLTRKKNYHVEIELGQEDAKSIVDVLVLEILQKNQISRIFQDAQNAIQGTIETFDQQMYDRIFMTPGRGITQITMSEVCSALGIETVSVQNAFFGPFYTYVPMVGDICLVNDDVAMTYQQDRRYYFKKSKVVRVKSFLHTSLAQRLPRVTYDHSKKFSLCIIGQPGLEKSIQLLMKDLFGIKANPSQTNFDILYKLHPRQSDQIVKAYIPNEFIERVELVSSEDRLLEMGNLIFIGISSNYIVEMTLMGHIVFPIKYLPGYVVDFESLGDYQVVDSRSDLSDKITRLGTQIGVQSYSKAVEGLVLDYHESYANSNVDRVLDSI